MKKTVLRLALFHSYRDWVSEVSEGAVADGAVQDHLALRVLATRVRTGGSRAGVHASALHALERIIDKLGYFIGIQ